LELTKTMPNIKNLLYILSGRSFTAIIGAALYEHLAVWPQAFAAPPASLAMFQGEYCLAPGAFWQVIHPVAIMLLLATTVVYWKSSRRTNVLILLSGYAFIIAVTFAYFVPELIAIAGTEYSSEVNEELVQRGDRWETLSLVRLGAMVGLVVVFFHGLTKE